MQRLGINVGKYFGEGIDIERVLSDMEDAAKQYGWKFEVFFKTDSYHLLALTRQQTKVTKRVYISTGIHGDEPAGPLALLQLLRENNWPTNADIWLCPCLNPTGFPKNSRENAQGVDLNRQYLNPQAEEVIAHINWLQRQPTFDVCMCLHEDWESQGFYVYEVNKDRRASFAEPIIESVSKVCPIDLSPLIEDRPAEKGIIRPNIDPASRPQWPEALYLVSNKTRMSYTLEAPSDFPLATRVAAHVAAVRTVLDLIKE